MIIFREQLEQKYASYKNICTKILREVKSNHLIRLTPSMYETDKTVAPYLLAESIYGPSYISFDYALSYYGLIPERVQVITSATYDKKKKKEYKNYFGTFIYRDVPKEGYYYGIKIIVVGNYSCQMATKEKAVCDKLYILPTMHNLKELECLLFDDLRIDRDTFNTLSISDIEAIDKLYHCYNIHLLCKYLRRNL